MILKKIFPHFLLFLFLIYASSVMITHEASAQDSDVVVIVHSSIATLTASQIKRIFRGDVSNFPGGGNVKVLLNSNKSITKEFCKKYLGMSSTRLANMWVKKSIRDGIPTPRKIPSNVVVTMVSHSTKFIGVVLRSEAGTKVKILE